jgi:hypothetical protein
MRDTSAIMDTKLHALMCDGAAAEAAGASWGVLYNDIVTDICVRVPATDTLTSCCGCVCDCQCRGELGSGVSSVLSSLLAEKSPSNGQYVRQRAVYGHVINLMVAGEGGGVCVCV